MTNKLTIEDVLKIAEPLIDTDVERSFVITESELVQLANAIHQQAYDAGVRAERENAADMLEHGFFDNEGHHKQYAAAIRARKEVGNE